MQQPSSPPAPPAPPQPYIVQLGGVSGSPVGVYEAFLAQREQLGQQLDGLQHQRSRITEELTNNETRGVDRTGLETRLTALDGRIAEMDKAIAAADARVAQAAAIPGAASAHAAQEAAQRFSEHRNDGPPEEAFVVGGLFIVVVFLPISIAFARRIWRRGAAAVSALPAELMERMSHLDQAVESIAIEVERIGEGQRFITRVMSEGGRAVGPGAMEPVRQPVRDAVPVRSGDSQQ